MLSKTSSDVLTLDGWMDWASKNPGFTRDLSRSNDRLDAIKKAFAYISESEYLMKNFLSFDDELKAIIGHFSFVRERLESIELAAALCFRARAVGSQFDRGSAFHWKTDAHKAEQVLVRDETISTPENYLYYAMSEFRIIFQNQGMVLVRTVFLMLLNLYSYELVRKIVGEWPQSHYNGSMIDFVNVLENWEEFKSYPIEWIIEVASGSKD